MPLEKTAKEYLINKCRTAQKNIDREKFDYLLNLGDKMEVASEIFPDELWTKELVLTSLILHTLGVTIDHHYKDFTTEEKEKTKKIVKEGIDGIIDGLATESIEKVHTEIRNVTYEMNLIFYGEK